ncbi:MAG: hypothetical protein IJA36_03895 [Lachnospiraceae bacterium]|nr:hypothetical protein [Lachnospiraceae bacterium]
MEKTAMNVAQKKYPAFVIHKKVYKVIHKRIMTKNGESEVMHEVIHIIHIFAGEKLLFT